MKKLNNKGFSAVEIIIALIVIGLLSLVGWYVFNRQDNNHRSSKLTNESTQTQDEIYKRTTSVPADWKKYTNKEAKITFFYPPDWKLNAGIDKEGSFFAYFYLKGSQGPDYVISGYSNTEINNMNSLVNQKKELINNKDNSLDSGVKLTLINEKQYILDDKKAVRLDIKSDDGTPPDSYSTEFYISAQDRVYVLNTGAHDNKVFDETELLTLFESLKIDY